MELEQFNKSIERIEGAIAKFAEKAEAEAKVNGKASEDTKTALENLGTQQREFADRLLQIEQKGVKMEKPEEQDDSWGGQFTKSAGYESFKGGNSMRAQAEVKNTITNVVGVTQAVPVGFVPGAFRRFTIEDALNSVTTTANAVEFTRELAFTNNAAETAEGAQKPESALTFELVNMPMSTVAHWLKVSRQLAMDAPALLAYINNRLKYGVNLRVENQLVAGNGTAPNISGLMRTGNYTPHGYTAAALGATNTMLRLVRKVIADLAASDYPADFIIMNPQDWANIELMTDTTNRYIVGDPQRVTEPKLWGLPVVLSNAMTADSFLVMSRMAATIYNREGVRVDMSESDADNFTKNLITLRAERRLLLAVEVPSAIRGGDLTPA